MHRKLGEISKQWMDGAVNLDTKSAEIKTKVLNLDRAHKKKLKTMKTAIRKRIETLDKLNNKKSKTNENTRKKECTQKKDYELGELLLDCKRFQNEEAQSVKEIAEVERSLFIDIVELVVKPALDLEIDMVQESSNMGELLTEADNMIGNRLPNFEIANGRISLMPKEEEDLQQHRTYHVSANSIAGSTLSLNSFSGSKVSIDLSSSSNSSDSQQKRQSRTNLKRFSSLSTGSSHNSDLESFEGQCVFEPIGVLHQSSRRYSTVRRSPSPSRSQVLFMSGSPHDQARISKKPPLPKRMPTPVRSPRLPPHRDNIMTNSKKTVAIASSAGEEEDKKFTAEDQEVFFYMSPEKDNGAELSYEDSLYQDDDDVDDLPPPPSFLLE